MAWFKASLGIFGTSQRGFEKSTSQQSQKTRVRKSAIVPVESHEHVSLGRRSSTMSCLTRRYPCESCGAFIAFQPGEEPMSCSRCGAAVEKAAQAQKLSWGLNFRRTSSKGLQQSRTTADETDADTDYDELLVLLMKLSLTVCMADLVDCMDVVRTFLRADHVALRKVADKVISELAKRECVNSDAVALDTGHIPSSSSSTLQSIDSMVDVFLSQHPALNAEGAAETTTAAERAQFPSEDGLQGLLDSEATAKSNHTDISANSYSDFVARRKSFTFRSDSNLSATRKQELEDCECVSPAAATQQAKPTWNNVSSRSFASNTSAASSRIRSLLRLRADGSAENIGDLEWALDGSPRFPQSLDSQALINRYAVAADAVAAIGHPLPRSGSTSAQGQIPTQLTSLLTFVMSRREPAKYDQDLEQLGEATSSWPTPSMAGGESLATAVLLDNAMQGIDGSRDSDGYRAMLRRTGSKSLNPSALEQQPVHEEDEESSGRSRRGHQLFQQQDADGGLAAVGDAGTFFSASGVPSGDDTGVCVADDEEAMERWKQRKLKRLQARQQTTKITYGAAIRNDHEQNLEVSGLEDSPPEDSEPQFGHSDDSPKEVPPSETPTTCRSHVPIGPGCFSTHDGSKSKEALGFDFEEGDDGSGTSNTVVAPILEAFLALNPGAFRTHDGCSAGDTAHEATEDGLPCKILQLASRQRRLPPMELSPRDLPPMDLPEGSRRNILKLHNALEKDRSEVERLCFSTETSSRFVDFCLENNTVDFVSMPE